MRPRGPVPKLKAEVSGCEEPRPHPALTAVTVGADAERGGQVLCSGAPVRASGPPA